MSQFNAHERTTNHSLWAFSTLIHHLLGSPHLSIPRLLFAQRGSAGSENSNKMALEGRLAIIAGGLGTF